MAKVTRRLLLFVALVAMTANAAPPSGELAPRGVTVLPYSAHGVFTGDDWRYRGDALFSGLALRIVADLIAIPSGAPWWSGGEWALFGGVVGSTVALSVGTPSLDVRFQNFVQHQLLGPDHFTVWNTTGDIVIWSVAGAATIGMLLYGLGSGEALPTETAALMIEAFAVAQLYHNMIKLLVGRAGPQMPELEGRYFGPVEAVTFWPAGTPSGHMASMYALLSVLMYSIDHPALWVGLNAFALVFGAALVGDNYHWVSDVILGAGIGFCVGRWVVMHRSTHYAYGEDPPPLVRVGFTPLVLPGRGAGLGLVGTF